MNGRRFQFSIRFMLGTIFVAAVLVALWSAYQSHVRIAASRLVSREFHSFREYALIPGSVDESQTLCRFGEIEFRLPASMANNPTIVRQPKTNVSVMFPGNSRKMSIMLPNAVARKSGFVLPEPNEYIALSIPKKLQIIHRSASSDFSFGLSRKELEIHEWSIANRRQMWSEAQSFDRFAYHSADSADAFLISMDPAKVDSSSRLRGVLFWENRERNQSGTLFFADGARTEVAWINTVALSFKHVPVSHGKGIHDCDYTTKTDAQILEMLTLSPVD